MFTRLLRRLTGAAHAVVQTIHRRLLAATRPATAPLVAGTLADLLCSKPYLIAENALLRQQLIILQRSTKRALHQ